MILTKTPLRISLFGGATDHPEWFRENGGAVLGFAIDKAVYVSVRKLPPYFAHKHRIVWSKIETVRHVDEIELPPVRAALDVLKPLGGLEIHYDADLPARSGMGSSSSFMVGLLHALRALAGHQATSLSLAEQAIEIERNVLGEAGGWQDQVWAAYGGFAKIVFNRDGTWQRLPIILKEERKRRLERSLMLFFTGKSRYASEVAARQVANFKQREVHLRAMLTLVEHAWEVLTESHMDMDEIGGLLDEAWHLKRDLAVGVSTPEIDALYATALKAGALGGKLLGAGGGGFLLFYVPEARREAVREALNGVLEVPFRIGAEGSRVVVYEPNGV